jgi:hypothetical protein
MGQPFILNATYFKTGVADSTGSFGTSGQVLSSTGTNVSWVNTSAAPAIVTNYAVTSFLTNDGSSGTQATFDNTSWINYYAVGKIVNLTYSIDFGNAPTINGNYVLNLPTNMSSAFATQLLASNPPVTKVLGTGMCYKPVTSGVHANISYGPVTGSVNKLNLYAMATYNDIPARVTSSFPHDIVKSTKWTGMIIYQSE